MNTDGAEKTLFDFRAASNSPAWQIVNDDLMGGASTSRCQLLTNGGAAFSGVVSQENYGGSASVRSSIVRQNGSGRYVFVGRVRGDDHRDKLLGNSDFNVLVAGRCLVGLAGNATGSR